MPDLVVAGAGMAGLVAAAEARGRRADVLVLEKLDRPGGSMALSSGVVWRYRDLERFDAPGIRDALLRAGGEVRLESSLGDLPDDVPVVLATGGFAANRDLVRRH